MSEIRNEIELAGEVVTSPEHSHSIYGEDFFSFFLRVPRLSGTHDLLACTASAKIIGQNQIGLGSRIYVRGQVRSYNKLVEGNSRLDVRVFIWETGCWSAEKASINNVELIGFLCKPPVYRMTPFGREITDLLVAVNRSYHKSDYIPVITWGRNARFARQLTVGQKITLAGRLQSREYEKQLPDGQMVRRVAYEVSVMNIDCCE